MNYKSRAFLSGLALASALSLIGCGNSAQQPAVTVSAPTPVAYEQPAAPPTNVPLDLQAVGELFRKAGTTQHFEQLLNDPSVGVNNLDRNGDGQVDYLQVSEWKNQYGMGFKVYDIAVQPPLEVATVRVSYPANGYVATQFIGSSALYGANYVYEPRFSVSDAILLSWMLQPHPLYVSPYRYGYYPSYYTPRPVVPVTAYRERVVTRYRTVTREVPRTTSVSNSTSPTQRAVAPAPALPQGVTTAPSRQLTGANQYDKDFKVTDRSRGLNNQGFRPSPSPAPSSASQSQPRASQPSPAPSRSEPRASSSPAPRVSSPPVSRPSNMSSFSSSSSSTRRR